MLSIIGEARVSSLRTTGGVERSKSIGVGSSVESGTEVEIEASP